ncbi:class I SAM-dependent methyltransferase [Streptomyces sp. NPDC059639]|uniref:class I SAM-dependent methyltransferase n=1 Tax=Streptomyces sp. NPDC059639 TaxID=3346891 RepID=UPI0036D1A579
MSSDDAALMAEQLAYYRARAPEYDSVYAHRADLRELLAGIDELPVRGDVLELACGTGQWTALLAERALSVTAVDASAETLAIARERAGGPTVRFVQADLFDWQPPRRYDTVFFGFWLSHVLPARFPGFWRSLGASLAPGGRVVFVDDAPSEAVHEEFVADESTHTALRRVGDGSAYRIVKVFRGPGELTDQLAALGWSVEVKGAAGSFLTGVAKPSEAQG